MIHSIDSAMVLSVCAHRTISISSEMKKHGHRHTPEKLNPNENNFAMVITVSLLLMYNVVAAFLLWQMWCTLFDMHCIHLCTQFFCICCIAWYSVCIFLFTLQQNHYLGIVRSNNKKVYLLQMNVEWLLAPIQQLRILRQPFP